MEKIQELLSFLGPARDWIIAIIIFLIGWAIVRVIRNFVEKVLGKTSIDDKLAQLLGRDSTGSEKAIASFIYYLLLLFVIFVALDSVGLENVVDPLKKMFEDFIGFIPNLIAGAAILFIAWILATVVKGLLNGVLSAAKVDERLGAKEGKPITHALCTAAFFFVILLMLPDALDKLGLNTISEPINGLVASIINYIPNLLGGIIIFAIGYIIASIVQKVVSNALSAMGADNLPAKLGYEGEAAVGGKSFSEIVSYIFMAAIIVIVGAEALRVMELGSISEMASEFQDGFFNILGGVIILGIGIFVANWVAGLLDDRSTTLAKVARIAIIVFAAAMALSQANIAPEISRTLFVAAIIASAFALGVGGAIAIGLGGRDRAKDIIDKVGK